MRGRFERRGTRRKCRYWMPVTIHLGVNLWPQNATWETLRDHALLADRLGFDSLWVWDHFYSINGDLHRPNLEGWQLQAAYAAITERVSIGCLVSGITHRHPAVLANMATTLDNISGGRAILGIGAAWIAHKLAVLGKHCVEVGRDRNEIMPFAGKWVVIREDPAEAQRVRERIARHHGMSTTPEPFIGGPEQIAQSIAAYWKIGVKGFIVAFAEPFDVESIERLATEVRPRLEALTSETPAAVSR